MSILPRHINLKAEKNFNLSDQCAASCVYLSPQEGEYTSSPWEDSKMYTSGGITEDDNWSVLLPK